MRGASYERVARELYIEQTSERGLACKAVYRGGQPRGWQYGMRKKGMRERGGRRRGGKEERREDGRDERVCM